MTRRLLIATMVMAWALSGMGCANKGPFRHVQPQGACFPENKDVDPVPTGDGQRRSAPSIDCRHVLHSTAYVEFQPNGELVDPAQAKKAIELIKARKKSAPGGKVITLVYVHGWKNNASRAERGGKAKDVEKFQTVLLELGYRARDAAGGLLADEGAIVPIVGIYVGWPGKSLMGPNWFTFLSYWSRRGTANKVGDGERLAPLIEEVIAETRKGSSNARVILIGHSFGARVLEHAIENRHVTLFDAAAAAAAPVDPRVDLVLYVNSANDARLTVSKIVGLQKNPVTLRHPDYDAATCDALRKTTDPAKRTPQALAQCRDYPLVVAITSRGDTATKRLQPFANLFSDGSPKLPPLNLTTTFADPTPSEGKFGRLAAGHMAFLHSHAVVEMTCPTIPRSRQTPERGLIEEAIDKAVNKAVDKALDERLGPKKPADPGTTKPPASGIAATPASGLPPHRAPQPVCAANDERCRFAFRTRGERPTCFQVAERAEKEPGKPPFNRTAFWVMDVDPVVIGDHGDVWNLSFVEMLGQLMAPRGFFEPTRAPLKLRAEAPAVAAQP